MLNTIYFTDKQFVIFKYVYQHYEFLLKSINHINNIKLRDYQEMVQIH